MRALERLVADPTMVRNVDLLNQELSHVIKMVRMFKDATAAAITVPLLDGNLVDYDYSIVKVDASGNAVTIVPKTGQYILGIGSLALAAQYDSATLTFYKPDQTWILL